MKLCKDCKHTKRHIFWGWQFAKCERRPPLIDLVTGDQTSNALYCSIEREFHCGPDAKYFEPKPDSGFFAAFREG